MKIAFDISPLKSAHSVRGIGSYTSNLLEGLKHEEEVQVIPFTSPNNPPKADLTHYPYFDIFFHTLPIFKKNNTVVTIHDVIPLIFSDYFPTGPKAQINLFFQKLSLRNVSAVLADSKTSKEDIANKLAYSKNKVHVVYLSQSDIFKPNQEPENKFAVKKKYNLPEGFILYVGDINWNKNILGLLESIKITNTPLVMVGRAMLDKSTKQAREIERKIDKLGIGNLITQTGFVEEIDLVTIYNLAKLTVLPSFYEGFGLPVLESMACATPVVCSRNSSLAEIGGTAAIFCDPQNPKDIAKKISFVLNLSKKDYELLQKRSKQHAKKYNSKKVARETIKVYKSVLQ